MAKLRILIAEGDADDPRIRQLLEMFAEGRPLRVRQLKRGTSALECSDQPGVPLSAADAAEIADCSRPTMEKRVPQGSTGWVEVGGKQFRRIP